MPVMKSCCCCSTRTGTAIIAVTYMLFTALIIIALGIAYGYYDDYLKPILEAIDQMAANPATPTIDVILHSQTVVKKVLIGALITQSVYFLLCVALLVGALKESAGYLLPWIIVEFVRQLLFLAAFIAVSWFLSLLYKADELDGSVLPLFCILLILIIGLQFYFWLAVIGGYQVFHEKDRIGPISDYPMIHSAGLKEIPPDMNGMSFE